MIYRRRRLRNILRIIGAAVLVLCVTCNVVFAASCPSGGSHSYDSTVIKYATETKSGTERHTCTKCGHSYDERIPPIGHQYGSWKTKSAATCNTEGVKTRTCSICGKTESKIVPATGNHNYGGWKVVVSGDCTHDGKKQSACKTCGQSDTMIYKAAGHSYAKTKSETRGGTVYTTYKCSKCGDSRVEKTAAGEEVTPPEPLTEVVEEPTPEAVEDPVEQEPVYEPEPVIVETEDTPLFNETSVMLSGLNLAAIITFIILIMADLYVLRWDKRDNKTHAKWKERAEEGIEGGDN